MSRPRRLAARAFDAMDLGVVVLAPNLDRVLLMNRAARTYLSVPASGPLALPGPVAEAVRRSLARQALIAGDAPAGADRVHLPTGGTVVVRVRRMAERALVVVNPAVLRDADLVGLLIRRYGITVRDAEIVRLVRAGSTTKAIGRALTLAPATVKKRLQDLFTVFNVRNRVQLVTFVDRLDPFPE